MRREGHAVMAHDPLSSDYSSYAARIQERYYGEYRARLDEERRLRQSRQKVIDIQAQRVDVETAAARTQRLAEEAIAAQSDDVNLAQARKEAKNANPTASTAETTNAPFMYDRATDSDEVLLKPSPLPRGMIVDFMA